MTRPLADVLDHYDGLAKSRKYLAELYELAETGEAGYEEADELSADLNEDLRDIADDLVALLRNPVVAPTPETPEHELYAVYTVDGEYDSAQLYRDVDAAEEVAEILCRDRGEGYAWTDSVTVH
ncbi:hypothetical protein [Kribbella italica]|uniref:Uncharacterized protein n=1 Tax=Kribbella italica TaxID=1540520 RepID=A0A7W9J0K6_9ACTN|nr:hypothetical protein [Kribbella italica]MBB5833434.1 hypothetical protein [Kribbella italica]